MNTNKTQLFLVASIASIMILAGAASEQAFAHGGQVIGFNLAGDSPIPDRWITVIMGHNSEPTAAQETGKHDGNHPMELFISDTRTGLNLADADLTVDKYYYKNDKKFNKAVDKGEFVPLETDVTVGGVHGDPGHYFARQTLAEPGIYGYHVTGTVDYFGVKNINIDVKAVCRDAPTQDVLDENGDPVIDPETNEPKQMQIFNDPSWFGGFGCTADIDDSKFPGKKVKHD